MLQNSAGQLVDGAASVKSRHAPPAGALVLCNLLLPLHAHFHVHLDCVSGGSCYTAFHVLPCSPALCSTLVAPHAPIPRSFLVQNDNFSFSGVYDNRLGLLVACLLSAIVGVLLTALLHGELGAMLGSGFQYWIMQPVYLNMLQVRAQPHTQGSTRPGAAASPRYSAGLLAMPSVDERVLQH
jgi:hypothetical protein